MLLTITGYKIHSWSHQEDTKKSEHLNNHWQGSDLFKENLHCRMLSKCCIYILYVKTEKIIIKCTSSSCIFWYVSMRKPKQPNSQLDDTYGPARTSVFTFVSGWSTTFLSTPWFLSRSWCRHYRILPAASAGRYRTPLRRHHRDPALEAVSKV